MWQRFSSVISVCWVGTMLLAVTLWFGEDWREVRAAPVGEEAFGGYYFVHVVTAKTIPGGFSNVSVIDHPLLNGNPDAVFVVTQNSTPLGDAGLGVSNQHETGVYYEDFLMRWAVYNEDITPVLLGEGYNIFVPAPHPNAFVHTSNGGIYFTIIDHPAANDNPDALVFATHNANPGGGPGETHDHHLAVGHSSVNATIIHQDGTEIPANHDFNVFIARPGQIAYRHVTTRANLEDDRTYLNHPLINGNPNGVVLVMLNVQPPGQIGAVNDETVGLWYYPEAGRWAIQNLDGSDMPLGAVFNVLIGPGKTFLPVFGRPEP